MNRQLPSPEQDITTEFLDRARDELEQFRRELKEVTLMLEQSQLEVNKITQRNASITTHLQQVQSQFDSLPRPDIRMAYDSALDAQHRLFVMRGQLEKLQSDQTHLTRYIGLLETVIGILEGNSHSGTGKSKVSAATETVEMMVQSQESERQRLSRQMHDGPAQALANFILQTEIAMRLFDIDQTKAKAELASLKMSATSTFRQVRDFIFELRPMMLDDLGLIPTIKRYVDSLNEYSNIKAHLSVTGSDRRLEGYREVLIFRAVQELLHNASQHSQASEVKIQIDVGGALLKVSVDDDGKGFDIESLSEHHGMGLKIIRDRVEMIGGNMEIDSIMGKGTRVSIQIPITPIPGK